MSATFLVENGRLVISPASGSLALITDTDKLAQSVELALLSDKTRLWRLAIVGDINSIRTEVFRRISNAISQIQSDQRTRSRITRSPGERLIALSRVDVKPSRLDPRVFELRVEVTSALGASSSATITLTRSGR